MAAGVKHAKAGIQQMWQRSCDTLAHWVGLRPCGTLGLALVLLGTLAGCARQDVVQRVSDPPSAAMPAADFAVTAAAAAAEVAPAEPRPYLLHLPGIGGKRSIDRMLVGGLTEGGIDADVEIYDWTRDDPGLNALVARQRNSEEAKVVAAKILEVHRADPGRKIYLTAHSGGSGILAWALEQLPDDVHVESIMLLAPALSPEYDLSAALRHVRGKAYVFHSAHDPILGIGTRMFGTIDGVKTDAMGRVGFKQPDGADAEQYEKLVAVSYDPAWIRLRNIGDHIGPMMRPFARDVLAPLLDTGVLPILPPLQLPATTQATRPARQH